MGIKDKLQLLSEPSGTAGPVETERGMIAVCGLADDLRDIIVEYQVSINIEKHTYDASLMQFIGRATEGNLQPELQIDCKSRDPLPEKP